MRSCVYSYNIADWRFPIFMFASYCRMFGMFVPKYVFHVRLLSPFSFTALVAHWEASDTDFIYCKNYTVYTKMERHDKNRIVTRRGALMVPELVVASNNRVCHILSQS